MSPQYPELLFGGTAIGTGKFSTVGEVKALLEVLSSKNVTRIDTAAIYPMGNPFGSEKVLGETGKINHGISADTKILLSADFTGNGALQKDKINQSVDGSFDRLKGKINVLYCHTPDAQTPIAESVAALQKHFDAGHFTRLGLSNYTPELMEEVIDVCNQNGYVKPTVYQGQYNALCRGAEEKLLPYLRKNGIAFVAYSPLAGGFLTGKLTAGGDLTGTRFEEGNMLGMFLRKSYDKPSMHSAVKKLQAKLASYGIGLPEASLRWLYYHSALGKDDAVILGANSMDQLQSNLDALSKGPLEQGIVQFYDEIWETVKADVP